MKIKKRNTIYAIVSDYTARVWNTESGECLLLYSGHNGSVNSIRFHPTKDLIVSASGDQTVHIWQSAVNWEHLVSNASSVLSNAYEEWERSSKIGFGSDPTAMDPTDHGSLIHKKNPKHGSQIDEDP